MPLPEVSVVVPTRGRPHLLQALVDAVLADPQVREVIVVVDGDDPASTAELTTLQATRRDLVSLNPRRGGQLAALDQGVARARSELVLLLDDDVLPGPLLASGHARHHARRHGLVVMGHMPVRLTGAGDPVGSRLYAREYLDHVQRIRSGELDVLDGLWVGNLSLRRVDCRRVGLRSERYPVFFHSDRDLGYRMADAGLTGLYDPLLAAEHLHRRDRAAFLRDCQRQGAGRLALDQVHPGRPNPRDRHPRAGGPAHLAQQVTTAIGSSSLAEPAANGLMTVGALAARLGGAGVETNAARLARRIMMRRGTLLGEPS